MPKAKPNGLIVGERTKEDKAKRERAEAALTPDGDVFAALPPNLKGHAVATAIWKRLAGLYHGMTAQVVSTLDRDLLVDYCLLVEQVIELDTLRAKVLKSVSKKGGDVFLEELIKLDARVDRKRSLLLQLRQSLYLTPRARAGVVPEGKPPEPEADPLEELLKDVNV